MSFTLGDLILAVSSYRKRSGKVVAAASDFLESKSPSLVAVSSVGAKIETRVHFGIRIPNCIHDA